MVSIYTQASPPPPKRNSRAEKTPNLFALWYVDADDLRNLLPLPNV